MSHIHNKPGEHDATASAYIVRIDTPEPTLMLHRHRKLGAWLQFGGHVEQHENPWQAIVHELREESGYDITQLKVLQPKHRIKQISGVALHPIPLAPLTHKFPGLDHYHSDLGYGFVTDQEPAHLPDEGESEIIKCFTLEELHQIPGGEIPANVADIAKFLLTEGIEHWEQVPASNWPIENPEPHFEQS